MSNNIASAGVGFGSLSARRIGLLRGLLWVSVVSWGVGFGAKLFDLLVLATAWGASPPLSLALLPYGKPYPINPGDFFQPLSVLLLVGVVGPLAAGWRATRPYRTWLLLPVAMLAAIWVLTPTVFWPMIGDLWSVAKGRSSLSSAQVSDLTRQWFLWDTLRTGLIAIGFISSLQGMRVAARHGI